jgi:aminotransferase
MKVNARPERAFYVFPNIKHFKTSSEDFAKMLLSEARVATVPGLRLARMEGYVRISYAASYEQLEEAMNRIERALGNLRFESKVFCCILEFFENFWT